MRASTAAVVITLALAVPRPAGARPFRVTEVPNGAAQSCETCHETIGGIIFNPFGTDVRGALVGEGAISTRSVDWAQLAGRDSDGDGFTNGQELGDPDGAWRAGDPDLAGTPSHPGDPASVPTAGACGDGQLAPSETCDGELLRGATCESQNLGSGTIACTAACRLDTGGCDGGAPGDGDDDGVSDVPDADRGGCAVAPTRSASLAAPMMLMLAALLARRSRAR